MEGITHAFHIYPIDTTYKNNGMLYAGGNMPSEYESPKYSFTSLIEQNIGLPLVGKNIVCIGDSLTEGCIVGSTVISENYPYYLKQFTGANVTNAGKMGYTAQDYWNYISNVPLTSATDIVIIMLGTNGGLTDTLEKDVAFDDRRTITEDIKTPYQNFANTNTGCYCKIIEYIMEKTQNHANIVLVIPPYNYYNADKWHEVQTARPVIPKIGERYHIPVIDAYNESGMNAWNGSTYRPEDNIHFNAPGYKKLAGFIASALMSTCQYM